MNIRHSTLTVIPVIALAGMLAAGCHHNPPPTPHVQVSIPDVNPATPAVPAQRTGAAIVPKTAVIYTVSDKGGDDNDLVAHAIPLTHTQSPAREAIQSLLDDPHSPLPNGTTLRGLKIAEGLATVDFSSEFQTHFHGSDTQEAQTVNSVLRTLGQFDTIERVQFLVEGKPIDALSQLSLSSPQDVIRTAPARAASASRGAAHE